MDARPLTPGERLEQEILEELESHLQDFDSSSNTCHIGTGGKKQRIKPEGQHDVPTAVHCTTRLNRNRAT